MGNANLFPTMVLQMCAIGEESGSIDHMLGKAADFYEAEVDEMVAGLSSLMEPIIIVILGTLIGGIVVSMYLPIFKLGSSRLMEPGLGPALDALLAGVFGLLIGSFLNVVIYRLPKIMERQWAQECAELTGAPEPVEKFNLLVPRSRCSSCGHVIRWYENIPVASYLFLRGKCSVCGTPYGLRYPIVEAVTGALFFFACGAGVGR
jgi:hypothetical protein